MPEWRRAEPCGRARPHRAAAALRLDGGPGWRIVLFASISLQAVTAVVRLSSSPDSFDVVLSVVQLLAFGVFLGAYFLWTPGILLTQDAVTVRKGFPGARAIPWADVEGVRVQGRWQEASELVLRNGRTERLTGVPVDDARRLSEALAARPPR